MKPDDIANHRFVLDMKSTMDLRNKMRQNAPEGIKDAAQQFEGMFLQTVLKSMRDATPSNGLMDSDATRFYTSILDQQMAVQLGRTGQLGFARLIEAQLSRNAGSGVNAVNAMNGASNASSTLAAVRAYTGTSAAAIPLGQGAERFAAPPATLPASGALSATNAQSSNRTDFVNRIWQHAVEVSKETGVPAKFLVAQAALESGWGSSEIKRCDGLSSYNIFGLKAGQRWTGETVDVKTTEYVNGAPEPTRAKFRVYSSYAEAFRDYARLLSENPRYAGVLGQKDGAIFASSLQQAGYATDPMYAVKISRIINGNTLRTALAHSSSAVT